ncbi:MAG: hypothetical protein HY075_16770 [Deltaproteobacteria bacterium]|nr:hypothetical protein [Deltaproteobacteria bacterium]
MADEKRPATTPPDLLALEVERERLIQAVLAHERELKTMRGLLASSSPEETARLRSVNAELKAKLLEAEKALAFECLDRKTPIDAAGCTDKFEVLKAEVLAYCEDRKLDPSLWKKLESL